MHRYILLILCMQCGCMMLLPNDFAELPVDLPDTFADSGEEENGESMQYQWWREFADPVLNAYIDQGLGSSPTLQQAWYRLAQSAAVVRGSRSDFFPQLTLSGQGLRFGGGGQNVAGVGGGAGNGGGVGFLPGGSTNGSSAPTSFYIATPSLSYEIDLWGRILAENKAAWLRKEASHEDVRQTALVLTGNITDSWFSLLEQSQVIALLKAQIADSETQLNLIELRFIYGSSTGLALLQQKQQLEALQVELPQAELARRLSCHRLLVLVGELPKECEIPDGSVLPKFPPLPDQISPAEMVQRRPDLRAVHSRLQAADYDVASALAERLPRLTLSLSYQFSAARFADLFDEWFRTLSGGLSLPFIDGGARRSEVTRREAVVGELLENYRATLLSAMKEVQDALAQEKYQKKLLSWLAQQVGTLKQTVDRSRSRYLSGQGAYLDVIVARESLQRLERRLVSERSKQLQIRATLYRALGGGGWVASLNKEEQKS